MSRFAYIESFPELYVGATAFHRELSTVFQIENIITTNWDDYFERQCGATPYVSPEDFALWELPGRKVFKIHGSVKSVGSIVATNEDYANCYERLNTGLIGSILKTLLATKTIVYVGYSFLDPDFVKIHDLLTSEMRGMRPQSYLVTLDETTRTRFNNTDISPIITSGQHFIVRLKEHLYADNELLTDSAYEGVLEAFNKVAASHGFVSDIDTQKYPTALLTLCYQDGLMHALSRIGARRHTGEYSNIHNVHRRLHSYEIIRQQHVRKRSYMDVAYIDGYLNGLSFFLAKPSERKELPILYIFGAERQPMTRDRYQRLLRKSQSVHRGAYGSCQRLAQKTDLKVPGIVIHHPPLLSYETPNVSAEGEIEV